MTPTVAESRWTIVARQFRKNGPAVWGMRASYALVLVAAYAPVLAAGQPLLLRLHLGGGTVTTSPWASRLFDVNYWEHGIDRVFNLLMLVFTAYFLARGVALLVGAARRTGPETRARIAGVLRIVFALLGLALVLIQLTWDAGGSVVGVLARAGALGLGGLAVAEVVHAFRPASHERRVLVRRLVGAGALGVALVVHALPGQGDLRLAHALGLVSSRAVVDYREHLASWPARVERAGNALEAVKTAEGRYPSGSEEMKAAVAAPNLELADFVRAHEALDFDVRDEVVSKIGSVLWTPIPYGHRDQLKGADDKFRGSLDFAKGEVHLTGTDQLGRDVFVRILYGTRISLTIGLVAVSIYATIGTILGAFAGYFGRWVDMVIMRVVEVVLCVPALFLILTILALFDTKSIFVIMVAIGLVSWTGITRLVRGEFLREKNIEYVAAAKVMGFPERRIVFRHVLPNALAPVLVAVPFGVASAILTESTLTFLGLGDVTVPSWGKILNDGREHGYWHLILPPAVAIFVTVTALNLVGDGLRDALDPKLRD